MVLAQFGTGEVFLSMMWFFLWVLWIWLLVVVLTDMFRSEDLSGWAKAAWCLFVIVLPYLGVFVYLIARGRTMGEHAMEDARRQDELFRSRVEDVVRTSPAAPTPVDQLERLAALRAKGVIDDTEMARMKAELTHV